MFIDSFCGFATMSLAIRSKVAQLILITVVVATEERRIHQVNWLDDAFPPPGALSMPGKTGNKHPGAPHATGPPQRTMDQLVAAAGHMDAFARKAPTTLLARAERMAHEVSKLSNGSNSSAKAVSRLTQDMAAMLVDRDFQEQAKEFARWGFQKKAKDDTDLRSTLALMAAMTSENVTTGMSDTDFQDFSQRVSEAVGS